VPSGFGQSVPGTLTMIVLMMTLIYGGVFLIIEKQQGMLRRQLSLPVTRGQVVAGKLLGRLLIAGLQIVLLLAVARFVFGLSLGSSPAGLALLTASYALAVACASIFLGAVFSTTEQASTVGWIASLVMAGLGGCWWPSEVMPEWLQTAAHAFPTAWAMDGFHALISFGRGVEAVALPSLALLAFAALFGVLGTRFLRIG
jgi:ABC-2 type transport system permease protein